MSDEPSTQHCPVCKRKHSAYSPKVAMCDRCKERDDRRRTWLEADEMDQLDMAERIGVGQRFCQGRKVPQLTDKGLAHLTIPAGGLLIIGPVGAHKTHLACARTVDAAKRGYSAFLLKWEQFALEVRDTYKPKAKESENDVLQRYVDLDFLAVDDLGTGRADDEASRHALRLAYALFDHRYDHCQTTDVTTNWTPDELRKRFDERISRRLSEMTTLFTMRIGG